MSKPLWARLGLALFLQYVLVCPCTLAFSPGGLKSRGSLTTTKRQFAVNPWQRNPLLKGKSKVQLFSQKRQLMDVEDEDGDEKTVNNNVKTLLAVSAVASVALGYAFTNHGVADAVESLRQLDVRSLLESVSDKVDGMGPLGLVYFSIIYIGLEVLALPAVPLTASAGYLFGPITGTITVLFSATIAAGISFYLGRTFLRKYIEDVAADNKTFQAIDKAVGREGFKIVLLLRLSPLLPFALSNYFYGLTSVEFWPYLAATFLGFSPGTFAYVYSGDAAKALSSAGDAGVTGDGVLPPWAYACAIAFFVAFSKVVSDVASDALSSIEDEE